MSTVAYSTTAAFITVIGLIGIIIIVVLRLSSSVPVFVTVSTTITFAV
jgi:hypothetical protein